MWGSRPSHFIIIPNEKRHPNDTKTEQLHVSEVVTGLPRPCHNSVAQRTIALKDVVDRRWVVGRESESHVHHENTFFRKVNFLMSRIR